MLSSRNLNFRMLTLSFSVCTRFPPPNSHLKPPGRCPISASHFSKKLPGTASSKSHCGNFRTSAPQPPRSVNGQPCFWDAPIFWGFLRNPGNFGEMLPESQTKLSGVRKRAVSKRVVLADVPPERKPERGYACQNHPFGNRPFISQ